MTRTIDPLPWPKLMQFGLGVLKLSPREFWSMTLPELNAALQVHYPQRASAIDRNGLESLMQQFPDTLKANQNEL